MLISQRNYLSAIANVLCLLVCINTQVKCNEPELSPSTAVRSARIMRFLNEPMPNFNHNRRAGHGPRKLPRSDNLHPPAGWRNPQRPKTVSGQQLIRREYNGNWPQYGEANQGNRFAHSKDAAVLDIGKNQFYRLKDGPQYNYHSNQFVKNFKASPNLNGNVAVKSEPNTFPAYQSIQQHAIPVETAKYIPYKQGEGYGDTAFKQTSNHHNQQQNHGPASSSYAVYEDAENVGKGPGNFGFHYQQPAAVAPSKLSKDAESYLHFMSTNEYFLPKRDPNYKQLDVDRDHVSFQQQKLIKIEPHQAVQTIVDRQPLDSRVASTYNKPLRAADLFYQQDPAPPNMAVVRGSYQAGQNAFVVKSDGNKSVKHILSTSLTTKTTQAPLAPSYTQAWHSAHKSGTSEPLRFEFTEHDAVRGTVSYTSAPQGQKFYYETQTIAPHLPAVSVAPILDAPQPPPKAVSELKDIGEYIDKFKQEKAAPEPAIEPTLSTLSEKDNEAYCEKICANVYDENDEIICGSDGYMYTGETQLECYSSCLNIDVSIKSKGSCSSV